MDSHYKKKAPSKPVNFQASDKSMVKPGGIEVEPVEF